MSAFPINLDNTPQFDGPLPDVVDVTIIGGGIIGVMAAWELRKRGLKVLLCEKGRIAGEQSSRNWGWIRQQGRDYAELPIMMDTIPLWKSLNEKILEQIGFRQKGITYLARSKAKLAKFEQWLDGARQYGVDTRMLSQREVGAMISEGRGWIGGMTTPSDAMAEPFVAVPTLAQAAAEDGVIIRENCAIRTLDITGNHIQGVATESGYVKCERVVVAAGAWSALFLKRHGIHLPQLSVLSSALQIELATAPHDAAAADDRIAFRRRTDGSYTLTPWSTHDFFIGPDAFRNFSAYIPQLREDFTSTRFRLSAPQNYPDAWRTPRRWSKIDETPFERCRVLDPKPNQKELSRVLKQFAAAFPKIGTPRIIRSWAGMIDTMPDVLPVVDQASISGLTIATGMSGHGFGIGPGMARIIADLVELRQPSWSIEQFALARYST
ncbi:FAD-binding oxidoreductase [Ochrobactrum soli]|uniref:FAD-binding oxidoreductase n=1 Tax=Ochrobactrum soli TaxID=2448455 RepID=A0A849KSX1_9HYPH|nr:MULTISPECIES: FAD-dependent oxidoreductase [Brucella]MCI1000387.1 FAD-binding oxidoreductase [Ochrobactrum sp. C6C9]RRD26305.1 FAD-binding oxidoreductase [Brucellaceae bacterium VT-16-1752]MDX4072241.1 FAD-dependent oxidoreductase [Brucella sp. NBRC 113783]NNU60046.1 FAD-binding oxidoreductase [[Ochrobactrum] soli]RLL74450.1 FAD-binding oxidoreductase [[Ochrobactrum] soli]